MSPSIEDVAARVWPGRPTERQRLWGGITNANFVVRVDGGTYVARIAGDRTALLGIDRSSEVMAGRLAASLGIAPEVVYADAGAGIMVTRFVDGRHVAASEVASDPLLGEIVAALRKIHAAGPVPSRFDPFAIVPGYRKLAHDRGVDPAFDYETMDSTMQAIARARPFAPVALCHNDLLNSNLLHDDRLFIVDWEYAGMGDPFFDLANLSVNHGFDRGQKMTLLRHYFGDLAQWQLAALELFELVSEAREAMWGVAQQAISALDFDFAAYAAEHAAGYFARLASLDVVELAATMKQAPSGANA